MTDESRLLMKGRHQYFFDGHKVPGVTSVIGMLDKSQVLKQWASNQAAAQAVDGLWRRVVDAALNRPDRLALELSEVSLTEQYDAIRNAHRNTLRKASERGTRIHAMAELLAAGQPVEVPDEHRGAVEAVARFLDGWEIDTLETELSVAHTGHRYAGTLDVIATSPRLAGGEPVVLDYKTSASGIYKETALQLSAYRFCDYACKKVEVTGPRGGKKFEWHERDMPNAVAAYAVHVRDDSAVLVPLDTTDNTWRTFLYLLQVHRWVQADRDNPVVGDPVFPEQGAV